jgi:hypothetical protein
MSLNTNTFFGKNGEGLNAVGGPNHKDAKARDPGVFNPGDQEFSFKKPTTSVPLSLHPNDVFHPLQTPS